MSSLLPGVFDSVSLPIATQTGQASSITLHDTEGVGEPSLPSFIRILAIYIAQNRQNDGGERRFLTNSTAFHEIAFSLKTPIIGSGYHFVAYANPFDDDEKDFKATRAINREVYCIKAANFSSGSSRIDFRREFYDTVLQELRVLFHPALLHHDNIINILGFDFQEDYDDCQIAWPVLVMEYAEYGTLDTLQQDINLNSELARWLLLDIASGIQALHDCNIMHGDVKSENVLICRHPQRKYVARLSDFGLSLINPSPSRSNHRLPGGTYIWAAPEFQQPLSVEGMRKTDVYSFGLTAWRVLANHPNPYTLLPRAALGVEAGADSNEIISRAKSSENLPALVINTLRKDLSAQSYAQAVIKATLCKDPNRRSLETVLSALTLTYEQLPQETRIDYAYWDLEKPSFIMEQLIEAFPDRYNYFVMKPSGLMSLFSDLQAVLTSRSVHAISAGSLLFEFAISPNFQMGRKSVDECCNLLHGLCRLGSLSHQAIVYRFFEVNRKSTEELGPRWLENAAIEGSLYAIESLSGHFPGRYSVWRQNFETAAAISDDLEGEEEMLLLSFRSGNYTRCKEMLNAGASAVPRDAVASPLHWLVSFNNEEQARDLVARLIHNGAMLDAISGEDFDTAFGTIAGTPLKWAVWHRNLSAIKALMRADLYPETSNVNGAIELASNMHFDDVLEVLQGWTMDLSKRLHSTYNWRLALLLAAQHGSTHLQRLLRHGFGGLPRALERTMGIILLMYTPSMDDFEIMMRTAVAQNNFILLRYLFQLRGISKRQDFSMDPDHELVFYSIKGGYKEIFDAFIDHGIFGPHSVIGQAKYTPLQACGFSRQPDTAFARRLLQMGAPVDGLGKTEKSHMTPFATAVQSGMYDLAILLLEYGADKDYITGWLGGSSPAMRMLQTWPDIPVSRLKFLLEAIPRLGFGHVDFIGWPGYGGNLLYPLAMSVWTCYSAGYRLAETAKYVISMMADKSVLNKLDRAGGTALRMAVGNGNVEICQILIEAGQDVNHSVGFSPLKSAKDWLSDCRKRETKAMRSGPGSERRLAIQLRERAEKTVNLLEANGAVDRNFLEATRNTHDYVLSRQWKLPSYETLLETFSGAIDKSSSVQPGSMSLNPTTRAEFRAHHGQKSTVQKFSAKLGLRLDQMTGETRLDGQARNRNVIAPRYTPHNCWPWHTCLTHSRPPSHQIPISPTPATSSQSLDPASPSQRTVEATIEGIQHSLLSWFCEGRPDASGSERQKRMHAAGVLQKQLEAPVWLKSPAHDIRQCKEFGHIESTVANCLEALHIEGLSLVPVLSESGRELVVHLSVSDD